MRTLIHRLFRNKITQVPQATTRFIFPGLEPYTGYPNCPGLTMGELEAHFRICRTLGEPA